jgi:transcriptional regulator with XRE-family HTH domain
MDQPFADIARRLKELREMSGVSKESLAGELGIGAAQYALYESGTEDIPVGALLGAAKRFGVDVTSLIAGEEPKLKVYSLVRAGRGLTVERRKEYRYRDLGYNFADRKAEAFLVTVDPRPVAEWKLKTYSHRGQEFNYVLSGRLKIVIDGHELVLEQGDSVYFDSGKEHAMTALGDSSATFLAVTV